MTGEYSLCVSSGRAEYEITVRRKYTFIVGDSGTGKTKLNALLLKSFASNNLIKVRSDLEVVVVTTPAVFEESLKSNKKRIYILDDAICRYYKDLDEGSVLAGLTEKAEGYFILITRKIFFRLPYSVLEIYEMTGYKETKRKIVYKMKKVYAPEDEGLFRPDYVLVQDKKAGFYFFNETLDYCVVDSAKENRKILAKIREAINSKCKKILVIADGAAFGSYIGAIVDYINLISDAEVRLYTPESFEYLVLKALYSGAFQDELENTYNYADSVEYFSWERYFTKLLTEIQKIGYKKDLHYLPDFLKSESSAEKIYGVIKEFERC